MKIKRLFSIITILVIALLVSCKPGTKSSDEETVAGAIADAVAEVVAEPNTLTDKEVEEGWILMFDGESAGKWRGYGKDHFPKAWEIEDGTMHMLGSGRGEAGAADGGDILYDQKFSNFHLKLEWKISEGGNSGVFYLGQENTELGPIWRTAPEMQVLDNEKHPDATAGKDGNRQAGSLYDLIPAVPQNAKPAGEWNSAEVKIYKGSVWHYMNGEVVLEYHLWTPEWNELVAGSKFPGLNPDWANVASEGFIGLQDHGDDVWYRSIKIKEL